MKSIRQFFAILFFGVIGSTTVAADAPVTSIVAKPPRDSFTHRVLVWEVVEPKFIELIHGKQSRDIGAIVDEGLKNGQIRPFSGPAGTFEAEFYDLNWAEVIGSKVGINNKYNFQPGMVFPTSFGPGKNAIDIPVIDGEGQITFERKITNEGSHLILRAPPGLAVVHPESRTLYTCVAKTAGKCAGTDHGKWHRQVQSLDWLRSHFFVEGQKK